MREEAHTLTTALGDVEFSLSGQPYLPVLLGVHGGIGGHDKAEGLLSWVNPDRYRMLCPSRPGYLGTPISSGRTVEEQADLFAALLDALAIESVAVVAGSAGGPSACTFAIRHPDRAQALVAVDCGSGHYDMPETAGPVAGVSAGLDLRYGGLFAGARVGYQRSWVKQTLDLSIATGGSLHAEGSLDESLLLLARVGWTLSSVPVYPTGGWAWSWASSSTSIPGLPTLSDRLQQDGGVVGLGAQPSIGESWFLELEYLLVLYRPIHLATPVDPLLDVQVTSLNTCFTLSAGYRF